MGWTIIGLMLYSLNVKNLFFKLLLENTLIQFACKGTKRQIMTLLTQRVVGLNCECVLVETPEGHDVTQYGYHCKRVKNLLLQFRLVTTQNASNLG